jgi:hypothetical protein
VNHAKIRDSPSDQVAKLEQRIRRGKALDETPHPGKYTAVGATTRPPRPLTPAVRRPVPSRADRLGGPTHIFEAGRAASRASIAGGPALAWETGSGRSRPPPRCHAPPAPARRLATPWELCSCGRILPLKHLNCPFCYIQSPRHAHLPHFAASAYSQSAVKSDLPSPSPRCARPHRLIAHPSVER